MIWKVVPRWGKTKAIVYVTICSLVGSLSVMAIKAFGIAVRLTVAGNNQFTQASTYVFGIMCIVFILTQVNYFSTKHSIPFPPMCKCYYNDRVLERRVIYIYICVCG